jgi:FAD/FMN-containing dehydrogenase
MDVNRPAPNVVVHIDELVLDGFSGDAIDLPGRVAAQVSASLGDRGLAPATAASTSTAIGAHVARAVHGVGNQ